MSSTMGRLRNTLGVLRTQILAAMVLPLEHDERLSSAGGDRLFHEASFDENAGRVGRNGLGSLEVGGADDW